MGKVWCFISTNRYSSEFLLYDGTLSFDDVRGEVVKEFSGLSNCIWNKNLHSTEEFYYTRYTPDNLYEIKKVNVKGKSNG